MNRQKSEDLSPSAAKKPKLSSTPPLEAEAGAVAQDDPLLLATRYVKGLECSEGLLPSIHWRVFRRQKPGICWDPFEDEPEEFEGHMGTSNPKDSSSVGPFNENAGLFQSQASRLIANKQFDDAIITLFRVVEDSQGGFWKPLARWQKNGTKRERVSALCWIGCILLYQEKAAEASNFFKAALSSAKEYQWKGLSKESFSIMLKEMAQAEAPVTWSDVQSQLKRKNIAVENIGHWLSRGPSGEQEEFSDDFSEDVQLMRPTSGNPSHWAVEDSGSEESQVSASKD